MTIPSTADAAVLPIAYVDTVPPSDTTCANEVAEAKEDLGKGILAYCHHAGNIGFNSLRSETQMKRLLENKGIRFMNKSASCIYFEGQTEGCYCDYMDREIRRRFGDGFLDSVLELADSLFVLENINRTFYYGDCDIPPHYLGESGDAHAEHSDRLQMLYYNSVHHPMDYIHASNRDSGAFVNISFVVDKQGHASGIDYDFVFYYKVNTKYRSYFRKLIGPLVEETKWEPATIRRQKVTSDVVLRVYLDKPVN